MKKKRWKPLVATGSVLLAVVIVSLAIMNNGIRAEAADTFMGIQKLIADVSRQYEQDGQKYTILEIVPNREAAQICYFFDGQEPALSTWNDTEKRWISWKEQLGECVDAEARKNLIDGDEAGDTGLKGKLSEYYAKVGLDTVDTTGMDVPVSFSNDSYEESPVPRDGFERIDSPGEKKTGWFVPQDPAGEGYHVVFKAQQWYNNPEGAEGSTANVVYYQVKSAEEVTGENITTIPSGTTLYTKTSFQGTEATAYYVKAYTLGEAESGMQIVSRTEGETEETSAEETSAEETSEEGTSAEETSAEETSAQETSTEESSAEESSVETSSEGESSKGKSGSESGMGTASEGPGENVKQHATFVAEKTADVSAYSVSGNQSGVGKVVQEPVKGSEADDPAEEPEEDPEEEEPAREPEAEPDKEDPEEEETGTGVEADLLPDETTTNYYVTFEKMDTAGLTDGSVVYVVDAESIQTSATAGYKFEENENGQEYVLGKKTFYCKNVFQNNEWFKRYALNMTQEEYEDFPVEVLSYTPDEINEMVTNNSLPAFDFLYLNSGTEAGWKYATAANAGQKQAEDISPDAASQIFTKVRDGAIPCLIDGRILYDTTGTVKKNDALKDTAIFKLSLLLAQEALESITYTFDEANADTLWDTLPTGSADGNFTTDHIYVHTAALHSIVNADFSKNTIYKAGEDVPDGFRKVLDEIELENLYRKSDTSGTYAQLPTDISQATCIRHIMNYKNRRNVNPKETIKILEIQPALTTKAELDLNQIKKWAPDVKKVETTIMTTAEFIGKIDTLNDAYDLIYIGTSTEHMNVKDGETVFNDTEMNGLIYYNVGDRRVVGLMLAGLLDTEYKNNNRNDKPYHYNFVRYGGNDITQEKEKALLDFLSGSYPVVVSDDFIEAPVTVYSDANYQKNEVSLRVGEYTTAQLEALGVKNNDISSVRVKEGYKLTVYDGNNFEVELATFTQNDNYTGDNGVHANDNISSLKVEKIGSTKPTIDGHHIDNCTYIYDFVQTALDKQYSNFYIKGEIEPQSELFQFYLNRPKVSFTSFTPNGSTGVSAQNDAYYISPDVYGVYNLQFDFSIQNEGAASADTRYRCELYIDVNADGKFSGEEAVGDVVITQNGGYVSSDQIYAGNSYSLSREIMDEYKGVLPWKVEVCQVDNGNIYTSQTGFTKLQGMEQEVLNICQISRTKDENVIIDLEKEIAKEGSAFHTLIYGGYDTSGNYYNGVSNEFDIKVKCISIDDFENIYYGRNGQTANPDYLSGFNMLILGFSDMYGDFSGDATTGPMSEIVKFINSGKSVLLAHDTTSFFNVTDTNGYLNRTDNNTTGRDIGYPNASTLNKYVRPLVGMDRYGILAPSSASGVLQKGNVLTQGTDAYNTVVGSGKDVAYKPRSNKKETVPEVQGYTYQLINAKDKTFQNWNAVNWINIYSYDWHYLFSSEEEKKKVIGDANEFTNTYRNIRYDQVWCGYGNSYNEEPAAYGEVGNGGVDNGQVDQLTVTQVNKGQITEYPYKIAEKFEVAQTHAQYYELDYTADDDNDGQSDLVVWYCLGGRNTNDQSETIYSQSPNDVRNNYYIYNKGNITYTGMGHSASFDNVDDYTWEEAKLFINTMIASYNAGIKNPTITLQENKNVNAQEQTVLYRYYDAESSIDSAMDVSEPYEKVYFTVRDVNLTKGSRNIAVNAFYNDPEGDKEITVGGEKIRVRALERNIYNASDNIPVNPDELKSRGIYYINVPKSVLANCERGLTLYFEAQSIISSQNNRIETDKVYASLDVLQTYLFDLN